jgi:hypothetical protein
MSFSTFSGKAHLSTHALHCDVQEDKQNKRWTKLNHALHSDVQEDKQNKRQTKLNHALHCDVQEDKQNKRWTKLNLEVGGVGVSFQLL